MKQLGIVRQRAAQLATLRTAFMAGRADALGIVAELASPTFLTITAVERNDLYRRALLALFKIVLYNARRVEGD
jgi:hypothetical protein